MDIYHSVKGTQDLSGAQAYLYRFILDQALNISRRFGFEYIELPILEHLNLFIRGIGEDTDVVSKELFTWTDKADRELCLRPEGTAQTVRFLLEQGKLRDNLKRYIYMGSMFRAEKPQKGRQREFHQIGIEIFGEPEPLADIDSIHFAMMLLESLGISNPVLMVNSVGCSTCRPSYIQILSQYFLSHQDALCSTCQHRLQKNPLRILDCKQQSCQSIIHQAPSILEYLCQDCDTHFNQVKLGLIALHIPFNINSRLVRGLDYYTQTAFEITLPDLLGSQDSVCGGGRYNNLVGHLSGKEQVPAVGLALGVERIMIALEKLEHSHLQHYKPIHLFAITDPHLLNQVLPIISILRNQGISVYLDAQERALNKKINKADKLGAQWVLFLGEQEFKEQLFSLKNMHTAEQIKVNQDQIYNRVK